MENTEKPTDIVLVVKSELEKAVQSAGQFLAPMFAAAKNVQLLLSPIQSIQTKDEDEKAADTLGKVATAVAKVTERRKEMTGPLDELKKQLMIPEKTMQSEFDRVKLLRDTFAKAEANRIAAEKAAIEKEKNKKLEAVNIAGSIRTAIEMYFQKIESGIDGAMVDFFSKMTLQNFEQASKQVSATPDLKTDTFESLFQLNFVTAHHTPTEIDSIVRSLKMEFPYAELNKRYKALRSEKLKPWLAKLDDKKKELDALAELEKTNKAAADAKREADRIEAERAAAELAAKAAEETKAKEDELKVAQEADSATVMFQAQAQTQSVGGQDGIRTTKAAELACEEKDILIVLSELMYVCITHPKHEGIYQRDRQGNTKVDEQGKPIYADWIQSMLTFYAQNCEDSIVGIHVYDRVSTVTKKK